MKLDFKGKKIIVDVTGVVLTPGNNGIDCLGNGLHKNNDGDAIECRCDECDYLVCCNSDKTDCVNCKDLKCPK